MKENIFYENSFITRRNKKAIEYFVNYYANQWNLLLLTTIIITIFETK
jgi:hypothetical protein